jgi:hypothetical protein
MCWKICVTNSTLREWLDSLRNSRSLRGSRRHHAATRPTGGPARTIGTLNAWCIVRRRRRNRGDHQCTKQPHQFIMRTLTALTAIFLPLNLITVFGMNFEFMPLIFECVLGVLGLIGHRGGDRPAVWRKRYGQNRSLTTAIRGRPLHRGRSDGAHGSTVWARTVARSTLEAAGACARTTEASPAGTSLAHRIGSLGPDLERLLDHADPPHGAGLGQIEAARTNSGDSKEFDDFGGFL